ncbi:DUF4350 domain-containing protein [Arthrobacter sp. M4]|uniref:DUF4350 domain-containing protein n=1 Tax=Arthrobacter sp. M4 TaxID=218160 RepID=UPI001CDC067A|nr:DUF4350 domain-containing protein [Arthrobacter sp. M4]MCA4132288.1 DUF4350 domain-containing protein [Arthrobacter sp. M4]
MLIAMLVLQAVALFATPADRNKLSTRNAAPDGAMALARVLEKHGVTVRTTDSLAKTADAFVDSGGDATVFLYDRNGYLDAAQLDELSDSVGKLVVAAPRTQTLAALTKEIHQAGVLPDSAKVVDPGCSAPDAIAAGQISANSSFVYTAPEVCYTNGSTAGAYARTSNGKLTVLGNTTLLSNGGLDKDGNAALAIRSLGSTKELIWFMPGITEVRQARDRPTINELVPPWTTFLGLWLAVIAVAAILWRGRRHGPLVTEPLPVVVKAAETAEGRARLYQDTRAIGVAADNLRAGCLARLARHFRLGPDASADAVVDAAERRLGHSGEARRILNSARPTNDSELVRWAQQVEHLEKEAKRP